MCACVLGPINLLTSSSIEDVFWTDVLTDKRVQRTGSTLSAHTSIICLIVLVTHTT